MDRVSVVDTRSKLFVGLVVGVAWSMSGSSGEQSVNVCMGGVDVLLRTSDGFVRVWVCHVV